MWQKYFCHIIKIVYNKIVILSVGGRHIIFYIGMTGFEPATTCSQSICATKLRYIPFFSFLFKIIVFFIISLNKYFSNT